MAHKVTGRHSRGSSGGSTALTSGKYTRGSHFSGPRTAIPDSKLHTVRLGGGHSAKVLRHPYSRGSCD